jgi:hypothetical protein
LQGVYRSQLQLRSKTKTYEGGHFGYDLSEYAIRIVVKPVLIF